MGGGSVDIDISYTSCWGAFIWYWFPGWIFQGLSYFTFICWAAPKNVVVNKLFGGLHGYGLLPTTLDWTVVSVTRSRRLYRLFMPSLAL